ncbi:serine hydrolase [Leucobacter ruminantium]|uniref:Beta-lactamase family protein n=1 Tax=Leucobacter ruminantium TaxID=1289170 RepID=A0A939LVE4_9MICO|nr:beta-lactamase family protein [Leucobacter ruminantium]
MIPRLAHRARLAAIGTLAVAALGLTACTGGDVFAPSGDVNTVDEGFSGSIDAAVESAMQLSGSSEAIVGVWGENGEYVRGYGEDGVDGGTRFRGAQATQPVICALLLDFVESGEVKLDDKVKKDLPRQSGLEDITYQQLCDMRSGLADYKGAYSQIFVDNPTRPWPEQELIAEGLAHSPLSWPGLDFHQSDTNAVLLGRALRVKSAEELPALLSDRVYDRAGMSSSYYPPQNSNTVSGTTMKALAYPVAGGQAVCDAGPTELEEVSPTMLAGAGATVTTVTDLKNFYEHYLDGGFGGKAGKKLVTEANPTKNPERDAEGNPTTEVDASDPQWSFGMEKMGPLYGRSGAITGTITAAYHDPTSGYTVVVTLNNSTAGAGFARALALQIAAISGGSGGGVEVPWSAEDQATALAGAAVCQPAPAEEAPEG